MKLSSQRLPPGTTLGPPIQLPKARGSRRTPGKMNALERRYADRLDELKMAGEVAAWWFEAVAFRVGEKCFWHPDFLVLMADGEVVLYDTKGYCKDDAKIKARAVAHLYPFEVYHVYWQRGEWILVKM